MSKFQNGEKVAAYLNGKRFVGTITKSLELESDAYLFFFGSTDKTIFISSAQVHEKQLRKLVKKKRKEIWVSNTFTYRGSPLGIPCAEISDTEAPGFTHYIEAPMKGGKV